MEVPSCFGNLVRGKQFQFLRSYWSWSLPASVPASSGAGKFGKSNDFWSLSQNFDRVQSTNRCLCCCLNMLMNISGWRLILKLHAILFQALPWGPKRQELWMQLVASPACQWRGQASLRPPVKYLLFVLLIGISMESFFRGRVADQESVHDFCAQMESLVCCVHLWWLSTEWNSMCLRF